MSANAIEIENKKKNTHRIEWQLCIGTCLHTELHVCAERGVGKRESELLFRDTVCSHLFEIHLKDSDIFVCRRSKLNSMYENKSNQVCIIPSVKLAE